MSRINYYDFIPKGSYVVYKDDDMVLTWNGCATFNIYTRVDDDYWKNVDCFTVFGVEGESHAVEIANDHVNDLTVFL